MKLLVTGGAGFIGSEFVRQTVSLGHEIAVIDKLTYAADKNRISDVLNSIQFFEGDIADRTFVRDVFLTFRPEIVVHWAAESHVDRSILQPAVFMTSNIIGTQTLLDVSKDFDIQKFINISTDEVYGDLGDSGSFYEDTPLNPSSPYSVSKTSADMLGRAYLRTYGSPVITIRPSNNYGPWQYPEKLVPVVILKALGNEKIPVYGAGENIREWLFVEDCASAVISLINNGKIGQIYNIGSGNEKRNIDVVKFILDLLGKPHELIEFVQDRPGHDFRYSLNYDKIKSEIGWSSKIQFEIGISRTVEWYLGNIKWAQSKLEELRKYWAEVYGK